ncbi:MAG: hypothetical protein AB8G05_06805 [Oligoflexales bacterium]
MKLKVVLFFTLLAGNIGAAANASEGNLTPFSDEILGRVFSFLSVSEVLRLEDMFLKDDKVKEFLRKGSFNGVQLEDETFLFMQEFLKTKAYKTQKVVKYNRFEEILQSTPISRYNLIWQESTSEQINASLGEGAGGNLHLEFISEILGQKIRAFLLKKESEISNQDWNCHIQCTLALMLFTSEIVGIEILTEIWVSSKRAVRCYGLNVGVAASISALSAASSGAPLLYFYYLDRKFNKPFYKVKQQAESQFEDKYLSPSALWQLRSIVFQNQVNMSPKEIVLRDFRFKTWCSGSSREVKKARKQSLETIDMSRVSFRTSEKVALLKLLRIVDKILPEIYQTISKDLKNEELYSGAFDSQRSWQRFKQEQLGEWTLKENHLTMTMIAELDQLLERKLAGY